MSDQTTLAKKIAMELVSEGKVIGTINAAEKPVGPLVNIETITENGKNKYILTVVGFIKTEGLSKPKDVSGIKILPDVYLNYKGANTVNTVGADGTETKTCRDFIIEYNYECPPNCPDGKNPPITEYDMCMFKFSYELEQGTPGVEVIYVRDQNDDPETDRGTVTMPEDPIPPTL